jgi:hypothetical protein
MSEEKRGGKSRRTRAVVDRIEDGGTAVLHAGDDESQQVELPASLLPEGAESGSHLVINVSLDEASRAEAEGRVRALQEKLEKRGGEGQKSFKL